MSETLIEVHNVSKVYHIGQQEERRNLQETLLHYMAQPFQRVRSVFQTQLPEHANKEFWALQDISFEVERGQSLGLVGVNGSGKSTLLKMISNVVQPSSGYIKTWGRVGALLEVGTGFNPELTGRENVYLKGAYHGMAPREIDVIYDEIVDFAGVENFMDTPMKRYSTGMVMRLGFATFVVMRPDIFIVDEVFAVGDVGFREKCIQALEDFHADGGTLLVVSHSPGYVNRLCDTAIWLEDGHIVAHGEVESVMDQYAEKIMSPTLKTDKDSDEETPEGTRNNLTDDGSGWKTDPQKDMAIVNVELLNRFEKPTNAFNIAYPFYIEVEYEIHRPVAGHLAAQINVYPEDVVAAVFGDADSNPKWRKKREPGTYKARLTIPAYTLNLNAYALQIRLENPNTREVYDVMPFLKFRGSEPEQNLTLWYSAGKRPGMVGALLDWDYIGDVPVSETDESAGIESDTTTSEVTERLKEAETSGD